MEKATIYDFARMCKFYGECNNCPIYYEKTHYETCNIFMGEHPDKANEIILNWVKEHPVETRQSKLLKCYPYIPIVGETVDICPKKFDMNFLSSEKCRGHIGCEKCRKAYWLAEVEE